VAMALRLSWYHRRRTP